VYTKPVVNLTRRGKRRSAVTVGIDYRDDHDAAREVIRQAVSAVDGVLEEHAVEVLLCELGESSVDFEVRYWTAPDIRSVTYTRDLVLAAIKTAIARAGMTIPWPIRTLVLDGPLEVTGGSGLRLDGTSRPGTPIPDR
jgi:small-conductance mechanosensitive channel